MKDNIDQGSQQAEQTVQAEHADTTATPAQIDEQVDAAPTTQVAEQKVAVKHARKKPKFSGAHYYVSASAEELSKRSFLRTVFTVLGLLVQAVVLLALEQGGVKYVTENIPSYAYTYMWLVFVMLAVTVYVIIMNFTRYKLDKRIPVERAPKKGFKNRAFFGQELLMAVYALLLAVEISFVCIHYDPIGLVAVLLCAVALAAAVVAREITHRTLKDAERIDAPSANDR